jgi:putative hydrolase of the HAD superfamily
VKAVLFDLGNTLIVYDAGSSEEVFQRVLASMGISRTIDEIKRALATTEKKAEELSLRAAYGRMPCEEYWTKWNALVLKHLDIADDGERARLVQSTWFNHIDWAPYPETEDVLRRLGQMKMKLGLITTAYEEEVDYILEKANISKKTFDVIVGADTIGKAKPHPDAFKHALKILGAAPTEALFIGDRIDIDYKAAENIGIKALLVHREEDSLSEGNLNVIANLGEIFERIT